jgi:hypothetical protein
MRLELQSSGDGNNGQDAEVLVNQGSFWVYDPMSNTTYEGPLPTQSGPPHGARHEKIPSLTQIQNQLNQILTHVNVSGPTPRNLAGQEAYTVRVTPKHSGGLLGAVQLGWDAIRGVPLRFGVYARGSGSPVLELAVTGIHYGKIPAADLKTAAPAGAKVVKVSTPASTPAPKAGKRGKHPDVTGAAAVQKHLKFRLVAPAKLVGLPRQSVELLDWAGTPAALVSYGQNLGGIAVIEQPASNGSSAYNAASGKGDKRGLSLPTVSINGVSGQELGTAIGTVVRFSRNGVTYTVLGSVPPAAAEAAARQL